MSFFERGIENKLKTWNGFEGDLLGYRSPKLAGDAAKKSVGLGFGSVIENGIMNVGLPKIGIGLYFCKGDGHAFGRKVPVQGFRKKPRHHVVN